MLPDRVAESCRLLLLETGARELWVACSGGLDSVVLLDLLWEHRHRTIGGMRLGVLHFNHNLRPEALEDELFVWRLARNMRLPLRLGQARGLRRKVAETPHLSLENASREARYAFFQHFFEHRPEAAIVTAHQADDQAETILMNLMRGAGLKGLKGIPRRRGRIGRPLLEIDRAELAAWAEKRGLNYREDASNQSPEFFRNRIRQELLPVMRELAGCGVTGRIASAGLRLADDWRLIEELLDDFQDGVREEPGRIVVERALWQRLPQSLRPHFWGRLFRRVGAVKLVSAQVLGELSRLSDNPGESCYDLGAGLQFRAERRRLSIVWRPVTEDVSAVFFELVLSGLGEYHLPGRLGVLSLQPADVKDGWSPDPFQEVIDSERLSLPLQLRTWLPGDSFQPLGLGGRSRKLKKFFNDLKFSRRQRQSWPLLVNGSGEIIWVLGCRLDHRFRLSPRTRRPWRLSFVPEAGLAGLRYGCE